MSPGTIPPSEPLLATPTDTDDREPRRADRRVDVRGAAPATRREERRSFLFFTIAMAPVLAVLLVAGYGFVVWMLQLIAGPPGS